MYILGWIIAILIELMILKNSTSFLMLEIIIYLFGIIGN